MAGAKKGKPSSGAKKAKPAAKTISKPAAKQKAKPAAASAKAKKPAAPAKTKAAVAPAKAKGAVEPTKTKAATAPVATPLPAVAARPPAVQVKAEPAPVTIKPDTCPCGSKKNYADCCEPIIKGVTKAPTAEALMRARYTSYVKSTVDFIIESSHPDLRKTLDAKATDAWARGSVWHGLTIVSAEKGGPTDTEGMVEFVCSYSDKEQRRSLHERAKFVKQDDQWYYLDGEIVLPKPYVRETPKVGRNDQCPCGSGKKYKKCHGQMEASAISEPAN
jgi:SEC-C motif-containing protein